VLRRGWGKGKEKMRREKKGKGVRRWGLGDERFPSSRDTGRSPPIKKKKFMPRDVGDHWKGVVESWEETQRRGDVTSKGPCWGGDQVISPP